MVVQHLALPEGLADDVIPRGFPSLHFVSAVNEDVFRNRKAGKCPANLPQFVPSASPKIEWLLLDYEKVDVGIDGCITPCVRSKHEHLLRMHGFDDRAGHLLKKIRSSSSTHGKFLSFVSQGKCTQQNEKRSGQ